MQCQNGCGNHDCGNHLCIKTMGCSHPSCHQKNNNLQLLATAFHTVVCHHFHCHSLLKLLTLSVRSPLCSGSAAGASTIFNFATENALFPPLSSPQSRHLSHKQYEPYNIHHKQPELCIPSLPLSPTPANTNKPAPSHQRTRPLMTSTTPQLYNIPCCFVSPTVHHQQPMSFAYLPW